MAVSDPELAELIEEWGYLPEAVRRGILAMVGASKGGEHDADPHRSSSIVTHNEHRWLGATVLLFVVAGWLWR